MRLASGECGMGGAGGRVVENSKGYAMWGGGDVLLYSNKTKGGIRIAARGGMTIARAEHEGCHV